MNAMEQEFWEAAQPRIPGLEAQQPIGGYFVDFMIKDRRMVIELDGHDYHSTREQRTSDARRERQIQLQRWQVIRFTGTEISRNLAGCVDETIALLSLQPYAEEDEILPSRFYASRIQDLVEQFVERAGYGIATDPLYLSFRMGGDKLVIEREGRIVRVAQIYLENGDVVFLPLIEFAIVSGPFGYDEWTPLAIWQRDRRDFCAQLASEILGPEDAPSFDQTQLDEPTFADADEDEVVILDINLQREIAEFADIWARNLRAQRWLELAILEPMRLSATDEADES